MFEENIPSRLNDLEKGLRELSRLTEQYQKKYFARRLTPNEASDARNLVADIRKVALGLQRLWDQFADTNAKMEMTAKILQSDKLRMRDISKFVTDLASASTVGARILNSLKSSFLYVSHYRRQCDSLRDDTVGIQEDAAELESSIEQLIDHLHNDIASNQWQIQLVSLYSQTMLTSRIRSLTTVLVVLTITMIIFALAPIPYPS